MNIERFYKTYIYDEANDKVSDVFHSTIDLLPFTANPSTSNFDSTCGIRGITGEFFRKASGIQVKPIQDYVQDAEAPVVNSLQTKGLKPAQIEEIKKVMKDLMCSDGLFVPIDTSFLRYIPLDTITKKGKPSVSKYGDGQRKIAEYLTSMLSGLKLEINTSECTNLLSMAIREALELNTFIEESVVDNKYYILPFISKQFTEDIEWILGEHNNFVILKYIDMFLYFYACYSVVQTIRKLDAQNKLSDDLSEPEEFFFILDGESSSERRDVVKKGWQIKMPNDYVNKIYGRMQAIDMLNTLFTNEDDNAIGLYKELIVKMEELPFTNETKEQCEQVLAYCKNGKLWALTKRESGKKVNAISVIEDLTVNSYEEFAVKLESICKSLQSFEYHGKMLSRVLNLLKVRFLQTRRGRGGTVLVLDNDMLVFLIAMVTKEKRCKLKDMYSKFKEYGICFDLHTRQLIENVLLKLNILERRSDSGEAQYVNIVL